MSPAQEALSRSLHGNNLRGKEVVGDPSKNPLVACGAQPGVFPGIALRSILRSPMRAGKAVPKAGGQETQSSA